MTTPSLKKPRTLIIVAHPTLHTSSRVNQKLAQTAVSHAATIHNLYAIYDHASINIAKEQQLLLEHDRIIFQFPIWWYSCPSLLKQWFDDVLTYGFAYGEGGNKLHGKEMGLVVTAGGGETSYSSQGYNLYPLEQLLRPFEVTANLIGVKYLPIFAVYNAMELSEEELKQKSVEYGHYLASPIAAMHVNV